ncbi:hypothetical protein [uncultured Sphingomonas sp.]|uniref:hypothetical protein n=1 Tax=uncultured Sphingomonas sp. TaxID=158754 RepID=UPI0035CBCEC9
MTAAPPGGGGRTLLFFCYGSDAVYDQTIYAVLTALRFAPEPRPFRIAVYCDRPEAFAPLPVEAIRTEPATLEAWLAGSDYIHRRKTCVLIDAIERFGGRIAFLDSDTYFKKSPMRLFDRIGPGRVCFHLCEGFLRSTGTPFDRALDRQLTEHPPSMPSGEVVRVDARTRMWNTGVVGIHAADLATLRDALALSDAIWDGADPDGPYGRKIHHAEQFAMGHAFRRHHIVEAADLVHHYWPATAKREFGAVLPELARSGLADASRSNLDRLYRRRYRERGSRARLDRIKMGVRRLALFLDRPVKGVRRSV